MAQATPTMLPHKLRTRARFDRHVGTIIETESRSDHQQIALELTSLGFQHERTLDSGDEIFIKPKRLGPLEILAILFGLIFFIVPGALYLIMWSRGRRP